MRNMRIIGLTGGIASGKSTVSKVLQKMGAIRIDADDKAHDIIEAHKPAWEDIVEYFGRAVLNPDLTVNREKLGQIVFNDPEKLDKLNQITHPRVMESFKDDLQAIRAATPDAVVVLDIPLLYEIHAERICDVIWVVWVDRETQIKRLMNRNGFSEEEAIKRIDSQMSLDEKARRANVVIDNRGSIEETISSASKYFNNILQEH